MRTAYISHPLCSVHEMGADHPETPARLAAIQDQLIADGLWPLLTPLEARPASDAELERVHPREYIARLEEMTPGRGIVGIDPDTWVNPHTVAAARVAAGANLLAVDEIMAGRLDRAFCAVRPPGHHAERAQAMGFCFFNNVALGVRHAQVCHGIERVAVLDFDVHQGNGTESLLADVPGVLFCSTFQHPFYPFTPLRHDRPRLINVPLLAGAGGSDFREAVADTWLPALREFAPQLLFISAGFDAHHEDLMADLHLTEADYAWVTRELVRVAERSAAGRIVSSLEGGYHLPALARSASAHIKVLAGLSD